MITIVLPISRRDYLRPVFNCLHDLEKPDDTELLIITDGDKDLQRDVDKRLDSISYKRIQVINFGDDPAEDIDSRRYRISAIHNVAKNHVSGKADHVFLTEDDTIYPPDALVRLLGTYESIEDCAFVEGVEVGRHKSKYIGAWKADDINNPTKISSLMYTGAYSIEAIDAGGFYCALVDADLYKLHSFEPYDTKGTNGLSCDVNFGLSLKKQGYGCYLEWNVQCDHIGEKGSVNIGNTKVQQVIFEKRKNKWTSRVE